MKTDLRLFCADTSCYIGLSESIAQSGTYRFNYQTHTKYPPGYPLFLSALRLIERTGSESAFIKATALLALLGVFAAYRVLKSFHPRAAFFITLMFLTTTGFFNLATGAILSDLPYFSLSMGALLVGLHLEKSAGLSRKCIYAALLSVLMAASVLTRLTGIMLPMGCGLWIAYSFLFEKKYALRRCAIFSAPVLIGFLCFLLWVMWSGSRSAIEYPGQYMDSYFAQMKLIDPHRPELGMAFLSDIVARVAGNIANVISDLWVLILRLPVSAWLLSAPVLCALALLSMGSAMRIIKKRADLPFWYFCSYIGMVLLWPFHEGTRFIVPVVPLACLYLIEGGQWTYSFIKRDVRKFLRVCTAVIFVPAIVSGYLVFSNKYRGLQEIISCLFWIGSFFAGLVIVVAGGGLLKCLKSIRPFIGFLQEKKFRVIAGGAVMAIICGNNVFGQVEIFRDSRAFDRRSSFNYPLIEAGEWIKAHVPESAVVSAVQKEIIAQVSGRRTAAFPISSSPELLYAALRKSGAGYLVIYDEGEYPYFYPDDKKRLWILQKFKPDLLTCIYERPRCLIFRIYR
jgi:hypothetical protein